MLKIIFTNLSVGKWRKYSPKLISSINNDEISEISNKNKVFIRNKIGESKERMSKEKGKNKKLINTDVRTADDVSHRNAKEGKTGEKNKRNASESDAVRRDSTTSKKSVSWRDVCFGK